MGKLLLLVSILLILTILLEKTLEAETTPDSFTVCTEIVYQGYVGIRKIVKVDQKAQSPMEQAQLNGLIQEAQFFNLPAVITSPKFDGCCDRNFPDF
jgi:hypothetical protein